MRRESDQSAEVLKKRIKAIEEHNLKYNNNKATSSDSDGLMN